MKLNLNRNSVKVAAAVTGVICLLMSVWLLMQAFDANKDDDSLSAFSRKTITYNGKNYVQKKNLETVLFMGLDKFESDEISGKYLNHQQADFMQLMVVDRRQKTYSILHLNRDTMTDIPVLGERGEKIGTVNRQLALSHTYGTGGKDSCRNSVTAVSNLLHGVKIGHYVSVTMDAVAMLNDLAGGVTLEVLDDFSKVDPELVKGKTVTLKGSQALTYIRTRMNLKDSSNLHRMERQRQYLSELQKQISVKRQENPEFLAKSMAKVADYIVSDLTVNQMSAIGDRMDNYTFTGFKTLKGNAVKGEKYMEYYVDDDALAKTVLELYYEPEE